MMKNFVQANKNVSLKEKWGDKKQAQNEQVKRKVTNQITTVNITKLMQDLSQDDIRDQKNESLVNIKMEKEYQVISQNLDQQDRKDSETKQNSNDVSLNMLQDQYLLDVSLLNGTLNIQSEDEHQIISNQHKENTSQNEDNQNMEQNKEANQLEESVSDSVGSCRSSMVPSSYRGGESTIYNQKCRIFESALQKIELNNFVIHSKVDEFLLMKKSKSDEEQYKQSELGYNQMIAEQDRHKIQAKQNQSVIIERTSNQRPSLNQDLKMILQRGTSGNFEISNRKRAEKFIYKQWEKECKQKFGVNTVFNQLNRLLSTSINKAAHDPNQTKIQNFFSQKCERKMTTIAKSPKSHLKERLQSRHDQDSQKLQGVTSQQNILSQKQQSTFKAKKLNQNILKSVLGIPPAQERPSTQFEEFNLSYKKQKIQEKENHLNNYTPSYGKRDGRISVKKVMAIQTPKTLKKSISVVVKESENTNA
eukprot:403361542